MVTVSVSRDVTPLRIFMAEQPAENFRILRIFLDLADDVIKNSRTSTVLVYTHEADLSVVVAEAVSTTDKFDLSEGCTMTPPGFRKDVIIYGSSYLWSQTKVVSRSQGSGYARLRQRGTLTVYEERVRNDFGHRVISLI